MKSVQTWTGDSIPIRQWADAIDIACLIGGADPAVAQDANFSAAHYAHVQGTYGGVVDLPRYKTLFVDSITDLTRQAMVHARQQPEAFSEKTGKPDGRGAYGVLGREVMALLKHLQHAPGINVVFVGILEKVTDEANRVTWQPQLEGSKIARELPGIVDQVITMSLFDYSDAGGWTHNPDTGQQRAFVCRTINPFGLPAKDRSGNLDIVEQPHLGKLLDKIHQPARETSERLSFAGPAHSDAPIPA